MSRRRIVSERSEADEVDGLEEERSDQEIFPAHNEGEEEERMAMEVDEEEEEEDCFTQVRTQVEEELVRANEASRFNPRPDEIQVRQIRDGYARLFQEVRFSKADLIKPESTRLVSLLGDANDLLVNVHTTSDATLDSRFMALTADLGAEKIGKLAAGTVDFNINDFCSIVKAALVRSAGTNNMLLESLTGEELTALSEGNITERYDWDALGGIAIRYWRGVQTPDFFLGPISVEPKEKKARAKTVREQRVTEPVVQPAVLNANEPTHGAGAGVSETASYVISVYQTLAKFAPVPFHQFVLNPESFAKTVENIFYVSFLVNDNRVRMEYGKKGDLLLHLMEDSDDEDVEEGEGESSWGRPKHQAIFPMTMKLWRELVERYTIKKPMIEL